MADPLGSHELPATKQRNGAHICASKCTETGLGFSGGDDPTHVLWTVRVRDQGSRGLRPAAHERFVLGGVEVGSALGVCPFIRQPYCEGLRSDVGVSASGYCLGLLATHRSDQCGGHSNRL